MHRPDSAATIFLTSIASLASQCRRILERGVPTLRTLFVQSDLELGPQKVFEANSLPRVKQQTKDREEGQVRALDDLPRSAVHGEEEGAALTAGLMDSSIRIAFQQNTRTHSHSRAVFMCVKSRSLNEGLDLDFLLETLVNQPKNKTLSTACGTCSYSHPHCIINSKSRLVDTRVLCVGHE